MVRVVEAHSHEGGAGDRLAGPLLAAEPAVTGGGGVALRVAVLIEGECRRGLAGVQGKLHGDVAVDVRQLQDGAARGAGDGAQIPADVLDIAADRRAGLLGPVGAVAVGAVVTGRGPSLGPRAAAERSPPVDGHCQPCPAGLVYAL